MLRKIRLTLATLCFALITLLFLDFTGTLHSWFGWLAKIQFLPAVLAVNVGVVLFLVVLTVVFGRIYCSVICPLGVLQDIMARIGKRFKKRPKMPYSYSPAKTWLRYVTLGIFIGALVAGIGSVAALLAPYSSYGRIASNLFQPLWQWGNNLLAHFAERADSYAFYETDVWLKSLPTFIIAVVTFVILSILAGRNGRTYCNTICPVGTILGCLSRHSLFRITIDESKCKNCNLCATNCKASCIDLTKHKVDGSRCVACMNCLEKCKHGAISYNYRPAIMEQTREEADKGTNSVNGSRRNFLIATAMVSVAAAEAQNKKRERQRRRIEKMMDGGLAPIENKIAPERATPLVPAGSDGLRHLTQHCTACQLCVSVCPNGVLRPSTDLTRLMQPEMSYERGYCRPECTKCSEVCPAGAIRLIDKAEKSSIQIGHAVWVKKNCIPLIDGVECGNCARHCPAGAIQMVPSNPEAPESVKIPVVNTERCIGCGACENLCPARPFSAIYVEGHERHRII